MISAICTLFEGDYHYGVGALTNSLYYYGFRGIVWAGYRGELPPWANPIKEFENYQEFIVADNCVIRFIKLDTDYHLTNYKPDFMLRLWQKFCPEVEALFYFDPDIVVKCDWEYFEEWISYGVALCEDVTSPVHHTHPLRMGWRRFCEPLELKFTFQTDVYVNGGFIGLNKNTFSFLKEWREIQNQMSSLVGGLEKSNIGNQADRKLISNKGKGIDRNFIFIMTDQDALNVALMCCQHPVSLRGKEAMDIIAGGYTMSHAIGGIKPWRKKMLFSVIKSGVRLRSTDKLYWQFTQNPIKLYSDIQFFTRKLDLLLASITGRYIG
jgi:hypothetical protein